MAWLRRRCQELSNGALVEGVADERRHARPDPARPLASPAALRAALATVADKRALAVLLVDLTDVAGSFLSRVRDLVGRNPVLLLGTKARRPLDPVSQVLSTKGTVVLLVLVAQWKGGAVHRQPAPQNLKAMWRGRLQGTTLRGLVLLRAGECAAKGGLPSRPGDAAAAPDRSCLHPRIVAERPK